TDLHGYVTTYRHDGLYRVVGTTLPVPNAIVRTRYDRVGNVTFVTDANGNPTRSRYDGLNRLVYTIDPEGNESEFGYDPVGNRTNSVLRSSGLVTVARFDGLNRPVEVTQTGPGLPTEGYTTVTLYEDSRYEQLVVSPRRIRTRNLKDGLDRVVEVVVADGGLIL